MLGVYFLVGLVLTYVNGCETRTIEILEPVRSTGDEVALIFTSGDSMKGDNYKKTAQAIQAASELRVWVALNARHSRSYAGLYRMSAPPEDAVSALKKAGMISDNFVGVSHGVESEFLVEGAKNSELKAIILMGSFLQRAVKLKDYPLPVLTLAAELDGVARVTRVVEEFAKLKEDILESFSNLYRTPVLLLEGVNHRQFASEPMPKSIQQYDLAPDVTEDEAHRMIGEYVNDFLTTTFSSSPYQVDNALKDLEKAFSKSIDKFQPFLDIKALDFNGNISQWTILAQKHIADEFAKQIQVSNDVQRYFEFHGSQPSITIGSDSVTVNTKSLQHISSLQAYFARQSPEQIDMKLKSKNAIWEALAAQGNATHVGGPQTSLKSEPATCKSLHELALEVAMNHSSKKAQDRYKTRGRPIIFEEDNATGSPLMWYLGVLSVSKNKQNVRVTSPAFTTPIASGPNSGMLYCKLLSPYYLMEWINIDSLKR